MQQVIRYDVGDTEFDRIASHFVQDPALARPVRHGLMERNGTACELVNQTPRHSEPLGGLGGCGTNSDPPCSLAGHLLPPALVNYRFFRPK